jgi:hypothetical protein
VRLAVAVRADLAQTVAFRYADPAGGGHDVLHAALAEVHLRVRRRGRPALELATAHGGAYELGGVGSHDVPLQPYPDP